MGRGVRAPLPIMRYLIAEKTSPDACKPIKGMRFKTFDAASKLAIRLSTIHKDTKYLIVDTNTMDQYEVSTTP